MGSRDQILLKSKYFFYAVIMLFYTTQRITAPMVCIFQTSLIIHHCMALLQVVLVSIPPHKFVHPPCWYYRLEKIVKYDFRVVPNCITSIPNFIQIRPVVLELNHVNRHTDRTSPICVHFMHIMQRMHKNHDVRK
jgi:hypothetical protein